MRTPPAGDLSRSNGKRRTEATAQTTRAPGLDRAEVRKILQGLASEGRLYVSTRAGLARINSGTAFERLSRGETVEVIQRIDTRMTAHSSYDLFHARQQHFWSEGDFNRRETNTSRQTVIASYFSSSLSSLDSLDFIDEGEGIRGIAVLPPSGSEVEVSSDVESNFREQEFKSWGVFRPGSRYRDTYGSESRASVPSDRQ